MKKLLTLLLLSFLFSGRICAQLSEINQPEQLSQISAEELEQALDSATEASYIPFHARFFPYRGASPQGGELRLQHPTLALRLYLSELDLASGDTLYIMDLSSQRQQVITHQQNIDQFWSSPLYPNGFQMRYNKNASLPCRIEGFSLQKKGSSGLQDFGDADFCEVNANCTEADDFRDVQQSVVRISLRVNNFVGWCTGTLVNNTSYNNHPYILTAEHCAYAGSDFAAPSDFSSWEFYFHFEGDNCSNPSSIAEVDFKKVRGARLVARSDDRGGDFGSDFLLLELSNQASFDQLGDVYFSGWNRANIAPSSGVTFHHPQGDVKKVSTFKSQARSSSILNVPNTHWEVTWAATDNGRGVTEPGSSGCPLFDDNSLLTGMLTGGFASCGNPGKPDFFGKFSYSWKSNGSDDINQLAPWLDPIDSEALLLQGVYKNDTSTQVPQDTLSFSITTVVSRGYLEIQGYGQVRDQVDIQLFQLNGQLVKEQQILPIPNIPQRIYVEGMRAGVYLMRIVNNGRAEVHKVIIFNN